MFNSNGARTSLLVTAVAPLVLIGVVIVVCVAKRLLGSAKGKPLRKGALDALPWVLLITFLFVVSVTTKIFAARSCVAVEYTPTESVYVLRSDYALRCAHLGADTSGVGGLASLADDTAPHSHLLDAALTMTFVWPIGCVVLCARQPVPSPPAHPRPPTVPRGARQTRCCCCAAATPSPRSSRACS